MEKEIKLILENQIAILNALGYIADKGLINDSVMYQFRKTTKFLEDKTEP